MASIPSISHFVRFGFNNEKTEKVLNSSTRYIMDYESFRKNIATSVLAVKETMLKCFYTFYFEIFFNEKKKNSNVSMKRYAEMGSSWQAPLSKLKYWVVLPPFITQES